jgi:hypothetical protein
MARWSREPARIPVKGLAIFRPGLIAVSAIGDKKRASQEEALPWPHR